MYPMFALGANLFIRLKQRMNADVEIVPILSTGVLYRSACKETGQRSDDRRNHIIPMIKRLSTGATIYHICKTVTL